MHLDIQNLQSKIIGLQVAIATSPMSHVITVADTDIISPNTGSSSELKLEM